MLTALEFDVATGAEPTIRSLPDMVKERLGGAHAFVGVLTRRDRVAGSGEYLPPAWVKDEIAIAYSLNKPVAVLAEEGVRVEGIIPQKTKYERWSRSSFGVAAPTIVRYLVTLRNRVSPPIELPEDLATIRALSEELSGIDSQLDSIETTLEIPGFKLAVIAARSTGRLYMLPEALFKKVQAAYNAVQAVEEVLSEISDARYKAWTSIKGVLSGTMPALAPGNPFGQN